MCAGGRLLAEAGSAVGRLVGATVMVCWGVALLSVAWDAVEAGGWWWLLAVVVAPIGLFEVVCSLCFGFVAAAELIGSARTAGAAVIGAAVGAVRRVRTWAQSRWLVLCAGRLAAELARCSTGDAGRSDRRRAQTHREKE